MADSSDRQLILASGLFDPEFYLRRHTDVAAAGVDPVIHYLEWGAMEGRRPHPFFDGVWYLRNNPDLAPTTDNPLLHYLKHGQREGRRARKRCVVYTAITRHYDDLRPPVVNDPDLDYIVFADEHLPERLPDPWIRVNIPKHDADESLASRFCKTHPHVLLAGYEVSAWVDGAFRLRNLTAAAMETVVRTSPIAFFPHPRRNCAYQEAEAVKALERDSSENVDALVRRLEAERFPREAGLVETGFIIRDHHDMHIVAAMDDWWTMIRGESRRDQLSVNFVLWKRDLRYIALPRDSRRNEWACFMGHRPATLLKAREELTRLEWELLDMQTTLEHIRGEKRIERNLKLAGRQHSDGVDASALSPPDTRIGR